MQENIPDPTTDSAKDLLEIILPMIPEAIRYTCYTGKYHIRQEEAEDLCQEVILALIEDNYRRLKSFRQDASPKTWIFKVVKNHVNNRLIGRRTTIDLDKLSPDKISMPPTQEQSVLRQERIEYIQQALAGISDESLLLFTFTRYGFNDSEVANLLGIPSGMVRIRRFRIIKRLRKCFS